MSTSSISATRRRWSPGLLVLCALFALAAFACESKSEESAEGKKTESSPSPEKTSDEAAASGETAGSAESDESAEPKAPSTDALLTTLTGAGYSVAADVPFDDDGAVPERFSNGTAPGVMGSTTWVLTDADGNYVQLFVASFADGAAAEAARSGLPGDAPEHKVVDQHLVFGLTFDDDTAPATKALGAI